MLISIYVKDVNENTKQLISDEKHINSYQYELFVNKGEQVRKIIDEMMMNVKESTKNKEKHNEWF